MKDEIDGWQYSLGTF